MNQPPSLATSTRLHWKLSQLRQWLLIALTLISATRVFAVGTLVFIFLARAGNSSGWDVGVIAIMTAWALVCFVLFSTAYLLWRNPVLGRRLLVALLFLVVSFWLLSTLKSVRSYPTLPLLTHVQRVWNSFSIEPMVAILVLLTYPILPRFERPLQPTSPSKSRSRVVRP